jgi:hypothetical protein
MPLPTAAGNCLQTPVTNSFSPLLSGARKPTAGLNLPLRGRAKAQRLFLLCKETMFRQSAKSLFYGGRLTLITLHNRPPALFWWPQQGKGNGNNLHRTSELPLLLTSVSERNLNLYDDPALKPGQPDGACFSWMAATG